MYNDVYIYICVCVCVCFHLCDWNCAHKYYSAIVEHVFRGELQPCRRKPVMRVCTSLQRSPGRKYFSLHLLNQRNGNLFHSWPCWASNLWARFWNRTETWQAWWNRSLLTDCCYVVDFLQFPSPKRDHGGWTTGSQFHQCLPESLEQLTGVSDPETQ